MSKTDTPSQPRDTVNRRALVWAVIPLVVSLLVLGATFYAFSQRNDSGEIRIAVDQPGTDSFEILSAIAALTASKYPEIKITLLQTTGSEENSHLLETGKVDLAAMPADAVTRPNFALIAILFPDTHHVIVRRDSGIKHIHNLPGKRIAIPPVTSAAHRSFWFLIGQYGMSPERMRAISLPLNDAFRALRQERVDAVFVTAPPGDKQIRWLTDAASVEVLPIDQASAMSVRRSALRLVHIPKGVYSGRPAVPESDIISVAADRILVTRLELAEPLARAITAAMFENRRELALSTKLAGFIQKPDLQSATVLPVHPGALSFYDRDQPSFIQENAELIGVIFSMFIVSISFGLWLKRRWQERQKGRIDIYNLELAALAKTAREMSELTELETMKQRLFQMLADVVHDLDEDQIQGEGFQYFAFTWEAARNTINDRANELSRAKKPAK